ncbi:MAG: trypsin-like serine protease [Ruminococcaceae bacterium]|nr:trypsin-like serine protease [Oscillospiraceae bacterium]
MSVSGVVNKVAASVVEVTTLTNSYYGQYVSSGAGSGVIIGKSEGFSYIVTNYHVVGDSEVIKVRLNDKREYAATYIDGDEDMDIAVLKIAETENIVQAKIGRSASLTVGEGVVAIGNPLGELGGTVTDGIISALDREINIDGVTMTLLQTNAAINPGNSGGGLFNMYGELIGIVNAKQSASGIEGLGFAIPIDHIYDDIVDVLEDGYIHGRLTFGFEVAYLDAYNAYRYFRTAEAGIYVITSSNSSVNTGDRIISVNSVSVSTSEALMNEIDKVNIGDTVVFGIKRSNGEITVSMVAKEYIPSAATN